MPEYLAPGVYVEEVSFRSKSIEAVSTSTTGMAGFARFGPTDHPSAGDDYEPRLVTSFTEFERIYGGVEPFAGTGSLAGEQPLLAYSARAFFDNGGQRLYVSRVYESAGGGGGGVASVPVPLASGPAAWQARWPGSYGNATVRLEYVRSRSFRRDTPVTRAMRYCVVEIIPAADPVPTDRTAPVAGRLAVVDLDSTTNQNVYRTSGGGTTNPANDAVIHVIELRARVQSTADRLDQYEALGAHGAHHRYLGKVLDRDDPADEAAVVWFDDAAMAGGVDSALELTAVAQTPQEGPLDNSSLRLQGGDDGDRPSPDDLKGRESDPDDPSMAATGLEALGEIDDISIVASPDAAAYSDEGQRAQATGNLIAHAERERYRIAVVDGPVSQSLNQIRAFRGQFDSKWAAMYHPWIEILDPLDLGDPSTPARRILVPPSGFVAGVYARTDVTRGVHKAPANETVTGLTRFEVNINTRRQDVLNPEGINALRLFEGRGRRIWGARTMSSDPEWKYVNVRRLMIMIEHSIDRATQWAVFEPNNDQLWGNIRRTVEDFLRVLWRDGALLGAKPEDAFFVRCDRTTMTQNDLDNGRLICLVGVAPTKPAEYVVFRVGQWTGDATT